MARWKLIEPHYLDVGPDNQWEQKETDRNTGRTARKVYVVPRYLHPDDVTDQNYPGEIVVCHEGKGQGADIIFYGDPTPNMEPLDDEAKKITEALRPQWRDPINEFSGLSHSDRLLNTLVEQVAELKAGQVPSIKGKPEVVSIAEFNELKAQMAKLMEQNAKLMQGRRV